MWSGVGAGPASTSFGASGHSTSATAAAIPATAAGHERGAVSGTTRFGSTALSCPIASAYCKSCNSPGDASWANASAVTARSLRP